MIYGAHLLRHFDLAQRGLEYLLRWQNPHTGGFYMNRHRAGPSGRQALYPTAQAGMACVITGRIDAAVATGRWFERLWALQPELPDRLYTVYSQEEDLVRDRYAPEERRLYVNEAQQAQEYHYNGGIAAAFLCQLHAVTGNAAWLALARRYQAFSMESTERQFEVMQVCKSGWGGALLYQATGEEQYRAWAIRLGDWFVSHQHADGHWSQSPISRRVPRRPVIWRLPPSLLCTSMPLPVHWRADHAIPLTGHPPADRGDSQQTSIYNEVIAQPVEATVATCRL